MSKGKTKSETPKLGPAVRDLIRSLVSTVAARNGNADEMIKLLGHGKQGQLIQALASVSLEGGVAIKLARGSVGRAIDTAVREGNAPSSGLTSTGFGIGFMSSCADALNSQFIAESVSVVAKWASKDTKSLEIDPSKLPDSAQIAKNAEQMTDRVRDFLKEITSNASVSKVPPFFSNLLRVVAEAKRRHEAEAIESVVGVAFVKILFGAMTSNPVDYGMTSGLTGSASGNIDLLEKILTHVATGEPFGVAEPFMMIMNECITMNAWRMKRFFQKLAAGTATSPAWGTTQNIDVEEHIPDMASLSHYELLEQLFTTKTKECTECFKNPQAAAEFKRFCTKLNSLHHLSDLPKTVTAAGLSTITVSVKIGDDIYEEEVSIQASQVPPLMKSLLKNLKGVKPERLTLLDAIKRRRDRSPARDEAEPTFKIFGSPLHDALEREREFNPDAIVPRFVEQIANWVTMKGLNTEGIFRISGVASEIAAMEKDLNHGVPFVIDRDSSNIHNLTGLFKKWMRDLPAPLCTADRYLRFLEIIRTLTTDDKKMESYVMLQTLINELPIENKGVLEAVFRMLYHICSNSDVNKMTANNLGVVFGQNILFIPGQQQSQMAMSDSEDVKNVAARLCEGYPIIFKDVIESRMSATTTHVVQRRVVAAERSVQKLLLARHSLESSLSTLVTSSANTISFWDPRTGGRHGEKATDVGGFVTGLCADLRGCLWVCTDQSVNIYSLENQTLVKKITDRGGGMSLTLVNMEVWMSHLQDTHISCFHAENQEFFRQLKGHEDGIGIMTYLSDGFVWAATNKGSVLKIDSLGQIVGTVPRAQAKKVTAITQVQNHVCISGDDGTVAFANIETCDYEYRVEAHEGTVKDACEFQGLLWTCSWDKTTRVWDVDTLQLREEIDGVHDDVVSGLQFYTTENGTIYIWSASFDSTIAQCRFFPDRLQAKAQANFQLLNAPSNQPKRGLFNTGPSAPKLALNGPSPSNARWSAPKRGMPGPGGAPVPKRGAMIGRGSIPGLDAALATRGHVQ